jgi:predicted membrane protein
MAHPLMSKRKAHSLSFGLFLICIGIIAYIKYWWPGIMLAVGLPIALRQYLLGKRFDMVVSLFVFLGVFITVQFKITWDLLLPILFTLGGLYVFFKEFFGPKDEDVEEQEEEKNLEIEDEEEEKLKKP